LAVSLIFCKVYISEIKPGLQVTWLAKTAGANPGFLISVLYYFAQSLVALMGHECRGYKQLNFGIIFVIVF